MADFATACVHHDTAAGELDDRNEVIAALMDQGYTADQVRDGMTGRSGRRLASSTIRGIRNRLRSKPLDRGRPPLPRDGP